MRITEITVSAGRVIPHPRQSFANLRPSISLKAALGDNDDLIAVTSRLQGQAEALLESHIASLGVIIEAGYQAERKRQDAEYEQRQRERSMALVTGADDMDDDEVDDIEDEEEDEEIPFETPGR